MRKIISILLLLICSYTYGQKQITIILGSGSGGGSSNALANFYLKDSTLSNDRTVDLDGNFLSFQEGSVTKLLIDPTANAITHTADTHTFNGTNTTGLFDSPNYIMSLTVDNDTNKESELVVGGDGTTPRLDMYINDNALEAEINLGWDEGIPRVAITSGDGSDNSVIRVLPDSIKYTSITHIFNGNVVLNALPRLTAPDSLYVKDADTIRSFAIADLALPTPNLQQVTDVGYITTQPIISNAQISASGTDGIVQISVVGSTSNIIMDVPADTYPALIFGEPGGVGSSRLKADSADGRIWQLPDASGHIPVIEGDGATPPASTPLYIGDFYIDTSAKKLYFATGTSSSADWTILN